jgi:cytochrome c oxidase subunit IV
MASNTATHTDAHEQHGDMVKTIWRTFWIMLIVTIVEIIGALLYPHSMPRMVLNLFFIVMSLLKAFYIVGVFMHLKFERKALMTTILLPVIFLVYAVIVLLAEGDYWLKSVLNY